MEFLQQHLLWWHWIVLGIALVAAEVVVPSFVIIWFGIAAIVVGAIDYLFATSVATELFLWSLLSVIMLVVYWRHFKRSSPPVTVGQSEGEYADIPGVITEELGEGRYRARFDLPVLGDRVWIVESESGPLREGDPVVVSRVYGQIVKVVKKGA